MNYSQRIPTASKDIRLAPGRYDTLCEMLSDVAKFVAANVSCPFLV